MRVYFLGSHGSGKTDMVKHVAKRYPFLREFSEIARTEQAKSGRTLESLRTDLDGISAFQRRVFLEQMRVERGADDFVSDRAFDNLAYAADNAECLSELLDLPECTEYLEWVSGGLLFFVRPLASVEADGTRPSGDLAQGSAHRIDGMIKFMLEGGLRGSNGKSLKFSYFTLDTPSFKDRWTTVSKAIALWGAAQSSRP